MINDNSKPFYLMVNSKEFNPGSASADSKEKIKGFEEAIKATRRRISEHKANNWDASEYETHLKSLEECLEETRRRK